MSSTCHLISLLEEISAASKGHEAIGLHHVADAALNIIRDMSEDGFNHMDIACLADIVVELEKEGYGQTMLDYMHQDAHDCQICQALAWELKVRGV